MPLKIMKPSASFFFDAKKIWNQYRQFHPVFAWNWSKIKIKNKDGFFWNLLFFIKQVNKSRVGLKKKWKFFGFKKKWKFFTVSLLFVQISTWKSILYFSVFFLAKNWIGFMVSFSTCFRCNLETAVYARKFGALQNYEKCGFIFMKPPFRCSQHYNGFAFWILKKWNQH